MQSVVYFFSSVFGSCRSDLICLFPKLKLQIPQIIGEWGQGLCHVPKIVLELVLVLVLDFLLHKNAQYRFLNGFSPMAITDNPTGR